ncbi:MAG: hypothetical protein U0838_03760 [Chloroflexota bacterium]
MPLLAAGLVLLVAVIAGGPLLSRLNSSVVAVPSESPAPSVADLAPPSSAPTPAASASTAPSPSAATPPSPVIDCGRIAKGPCERAIALAREISGPDVANASLIVVDDTCPPGSMCDRKYAFDALVVFVTAGADTTGWYAVSVTGVDAVTPADAQAWADQLPAHIRARLVELTRPSPSGSPAATPSPIPSPSAIAGTGPLLGCGQGDVRFRASLLDGEPALTGPDEAIRALRAYLGTGADPGMPTDGWRTVAASDTAVTFLAPGGGTWWTITVAPDPAGGWQDWESGECHLAVVPPAGMAYAAWSLDPKHPPKPGATSVTVLATELACANGRPPGERLQAPVVVETGTSVTITILVKRLGNADCPGNPAVPVVVQLDAPLSTRTLLDGSTYPASER